MWAVCNTRNRTHNTGPVRSMGAGTSKTGLKKRNHKKELISQYSAKKDTCTSTCSLALSLCVCRCLCMCLPLFLRDSLCCSLLPHPIPSPLLSVSLSLPTCHSTYPWVDAEDFGRVVWDAVDAPVTRRNHPAVPFPPAPFPARAWLA